ncbi:hypothetical protein B0T25DRAFT_524496 [Lasiosphaeria hispida]|uniref:Uncharacterized protein n=1 Tax=Lasiosphaeria hispida TaxID=260671 RepID=A0AAJ0HTC5_9PEZI|nr:hypothetical protein B0T25DRAFT_524496 [Lasiosphaeria hispida]
MSLFDRQAIPSEFLYNKQQQGGKPTTEIQLTKALEVLKAFSFVTEDKDHNLDMAYAACYSGVARQQWHTTAVHRTSAVSSIAGLPIRLL